jgi:hypothetical protein
MVSLTLEIGLFLTKGGTARERTGWGLEGVRVTAKRID